VAIFSIETLRQKARDAERVSDMNTIGTAYNKIIFEYGDYLASGCSLGHVHACSGNLEMMKVLPAIGGIKDPTYENNTEPCSFELCRAGVSSCDYALLEQTETYFEILFNLEHGVDDYGEKGCYLLTPIGIQKID
jgi:hypothetical protein